MFRLSDGEEIMTLAFFVLIQYRSVTDGRTDGHICSGYTSACIACYANALVKIIPAHKNLRIFANIFFGHQLAFYTTDFVNCELVFVFISEYLCKCIMYMPDKYTKGAISKSALTRAMPKRSSN